MKKKIQGWFNFQGFYKRMVEEAEPGDRFIEIGVWKGKSIIFLGNQVKKSGKDITIYAMDTFEGDGGEKHNKLIAELDTTLENVFLSNIKEAGLSHMITVIKDASPKGALRFPDRFFKMVYIDADHSYQAVRADILFWMPKVKKGGYLAGHDYLANPNVTKAVNDTLGEVEFEKNTWYLRFD